MIGAGFIHVGKDEGDKKALLNTLKPPKPKKLSNKKPLDEKKKTESIGKTIDTFAKEAKRKALPLYACTGWKCLFRKTLVSTKTDLAKKHIIQNHQKYKLSTMYKKEVRERGRAYEFEGPNGKSVTILVKKNSNGTTSYKYSTTGVPGSWKSFQYKTLAANAKVITLDDALSKIFSGRIKVITKMKTAFFNAALNAKKNLSGSGTVSGDLWLKKGKFGFTPSYEYFGLDYEITTSKSGKRTVSLTLGTKAGAPPQIQFTLDQSDFYRLAGIKTRTTKVGVAGRKGRKR